MSHTVLDSIALGYQPVWSAARQLAAVRLSVHTVHAEAVDAAHLLQILGDDWPLSAPVLILSFDNEALWRQALTCKPVANTWLEVPGTYFSPTDPPSELEAGAGQGHELLRRTDLASVRDEGRPPLGVRSLLTLDCADDGPPDAVSPGGPFGSVQNPGLFSAAVLEGVFSQAMVAPCLDVLGAWGLLGWPDADVLQARGDRPMSCDAGVIHQVLGAIERDASLDQIERFVRQDPVLVYRLLLLVNSDAYRRRHEVESLRHALMMMGFGALGTWLNQQLRGAETDVALHPVRYGMVMRARLAQHLLDTNSDDSLRSEVFLTALFAQLDRLLHKPLTELLDPLPMPARAFDALLRETGPYNAYLDVSRAQADTGQLHLLAELCAHHRISLEQANRGLLRMLATSRDQRRGSP